MTWIGGTGPGSGALPCADGAHWVLSQADGVAKAVLLVDGITADMQPADGGTFSADTTGAIVIGDVAVATYEGGGNDSPTLSLNGCLDASPSPTTGPSPTDAPPTSTPPPVGSRPVTGGGTSGGASATGQGLRGVAGSSPQTRGGASAITGGHAGAGAFPARTRQAASTVRSGVPSVSPTTDTSRAPVEGEGGTTSSGLADPRTPPVAFVVGILVAVAVISAFGARQYFGRSARRTA